MVRLEKHVLAAYYNDARLNILHCLNDIREKSGKARVYNESEIKSAFDSLNLTQATPEQQDELIRHLRFRFPFLNVLNDPNASVSQKNKQDNAATLPRYYQSQLTWLLKLVHDLRNTFNHPVDQGQQIPIDLHKKLYFALSEIYDSSFHTVKNRFAHSTQTMQALQRCGKNGKPKPINKFTLALCSDPLNLAKDSHSSVDDVFYDFGQVLFCSLFLEKSQSAELIDYFWKTHGENWKQLHRSIVREMIAVYRLKLPIQNLRSDDIKITVTLDTLSELSRCPRALLNRLSPKDQKHFRGEIGADVVEDEADSEATNIGSTFLFARSRQDRFIPLIMRFLDFNPDNKLRFAVDLGNFYYNVRLKPASQFADNRARVRRLGQKILTYQRLHLLQAFEKPKDWQLLEANYQSSREAEEQITKQAGDSIEQLKPYIVPTYPHYHYFDDKIGFRLDISKDESPAAYPDLRAHAANDSVSLNSPTGAELMPEFWASPAMFLQLAFYNYLQQKDNRLLPLNILLTKYRVNLQSLFQSLQQGGVPALAGTAQSNERRQAAQAWIDSFFTHKEKEPRTFEVRLSSLPKVVIRALLGVNATELKPELIIARAKHLLADTERRQKQLKRLLQEPKKRGQKGFKAIKCGVMGDFIADDLMRFQPVDSSRSDGGKINSQHYQMLQKTLAYYGAHLEEPPRIVDLLEQAGLLSGDFAHPFLAQLGLAQRPEKYRGLISFYEAYLQARESYLKQFIAQQQQSTKLEKIPHWLGLRQPASLQNWLNEQLDEQGKFKQPVPLLNNMFYPLILNKVAHTLGIDPDELAAQGTQTLERSTEAVAVRPSVTWLLQRYLAAQGDEAQAMYDYPRRHDLFDVWLDKRTPKQRFKEKKVHFLQKAERVAHVDKIREHLQHTPPSKGKPTEVAERQEKLRKLLKSYQRDELSVRHLVAQDMLLYLYASQHLNPLQFNQASRKHVWHLQTLEKTLLSAKRKHALPVPANKPERVLYHPSCRIRDHGELALLVRDRRLPSLLDYYPSTEKELHRDEIRAELRAYHRAKVKIMERVLGLERQLKKVLGNVPQRDEALIKQSKAVFGKGRHGDFLYALQQLAQQDGRDSEASFADASFKRALAIRNAFSHNQYPKAAEFPAVVQAVQTEQTPENPAHHRQVASRLLDEMQKVVTPWLDYLRHRKG